MAGLCAPGILPAAVIQLFIRRPAVFLLPYRPPFRGYKQPDSTARNSLRGLSGCGMRLWPASYQMQTGTAKRAACQTLLSERLGYPLGFLYTL